MAKKKRKSTEELWNDWEHEVRSSSICQIDFETQDGVFSVFVERNQINGIGYRANFVENGYHLENIAHTTLVGVVVLAVETAFKSYRAISLLRYE